MSAAFTGPGPDAIYARHLAEGRFMIQRCGACGTHLFYPRLLCTTCGAPEPGFVPASGSGTVHSFTVQRRRPEQGGDMSLVLVDLEEGPRMLSRIDGMAPADVTIGMTVQAGIVEEGDRRFITFTKA